MWFCYPLGKGETSLNSNVMIRCENLSFSYDKDHGEDWNAAVDNVTSVIKTSDYFIHFCYAI